MIPIENVLSFDSFSREDSYSCPLTGTVSLNEQLFNNEGLNK